MVTIRAGFKRTVQMKQFEPLVIELSVEESERLGQAGAATIVAVKALYLELEKVGNVLVNHALSTPDPAGRK